MLEKLTLVPTAGLCNRLNAINSAIELKRLHPNIEVNIFWENTYDCKAFFTDLFKQLDCSFNINKGVQRLEKYYLCPGSKRNLYIPNILKKFYFDAFFNAVNYNRMNFFEIVQNYKNVYISSYNPFTPYEIEESLGNIFKPVQELQDIIDSIRSSYAKNTIGLHIRRTDNLVAIKNSPIEKFYKFIDDEIKKDNEVKFFLATDSQEVKELLKKKYPQRILFYNSTLNRNSLQGMKDAVVELYCLGYTSKILGSQGSTYTNLASRLFNIELIK